MLDLAIRALEMRHYSTQAVLKMPFDILIPDRQTREIFLEYAENHLKVRLDEWYLEADRTLQDWAVGIAGSSPAFMVETELRQEVDTFYLLDDNLARLCQIADELKKEFARLAGETSRQVTLTTNLGMEDGRLAPEQRSALRNFAATMIGVEPQVIEGQAFSSLAGLAYGFGKQSKPWVVEKKCWMKEYRTYSIKVLTVSIGISQYMKWLR